MLRYRLFFFCCIGLFAFLNPDRGFATDTPELSVDASIATAGYYRLQWQANHAKNPSFILQESQEESFQTPFTRYQGSDRARVISGKSDGDYFYRVRLEDNTQWSDVVKVQVRHHSLGDAFLFFSIGLFIFLSTLFVIYRGNKSAR